MLLLGHTGITLGLAWASQSLWRRRRKIVAATPFQQSDRRTAVGEFPAPGAQKPSHSHHLDYRLVLLGSMLPDIIDKPVGIYVLQHVFSNGRIIAHTALFTLALLVAGAVLWRRRGYILLTLGYGSFMHLVLDGMWANQRTLWWPLQGWAFARGDMSHWLQRMLFALTHVPGAYLSEAVGAVILVAFFGTLMTRGRLGQWFRTGRAG